LKLDIDVWLRGIGFAQYAGMFRANDIDIELLSRLTNDDLKDIGVVSLGHRKKLLEAIAALVAAREAPAPIPVTVTEPKTQDTAERRQVTVMFSDLVGSTALSARMDPEDLREIISAYQKCVAETVRRCGGFVAKYMGDGVLIYFGYPKAHEDDAERAVRAGLQLIAAVTALKSSVPLQTRVGIATGLVVVGDLIGSGEAQEHGIVGETPNLAARLQGIAEPNMVVIAEGTRRLLGNLFEFEDLGAKNLKGIAGPVRAWAALRASSAEGRFEALHTAGLTALVGREEELELLLQRWSRAKLGEGRVVLLSGEAGIGKSRLTAALLERLAAEPQTRLRYFCSPQHTDSAFHPIIGQMERAAGLAHDDKPQAKLDKLDAVLAQTSTSTEDVALFAEMLSLPNDGRYPALDLAPQRRRQRTLEALTSQLAGLARQQPVLMICEDAHWVDPTSLEVLGRTVDRIKTLPVLLIVTFRPEFTAPWVGQSHLTSLTLSRLGEREAAVIVARLVGNKALPADVMVAIVERTDGIPLFVEEMTKAVLEAESEGAARRTVASVPSPALAVPASLHASLMARLDRLGEPRTVAQIGAALGREFSHELIVAVTSLPRQQLEAALDALVAAGVIFRRGVPPNAEYTFKHALLQDVAHGSLTRRSRQELHARIASVFEQAFPGLAAGQPERLAQHHAQAGAPEKAAGYSLKAGLRALAQSAMTEAAAQLRNGLHLLSSSPESDERERLELDLQLALARTMMATQGYAALAVGEAYARARELCLRLDRPPQLVTVLYGQFLHNFMRAELQKAWGLAQEMLRLGEAQNKPPLTLMGRRLLGVTALALGDFATAAAHLERCLEDFDPADRPFYASLAIDDLRINMMGYLATALISLGRLDEAHARIAATLDEARRLSHGYTLVHALMTACLCDWCGAEWTSLLRHVEEALELSNRHGFALFRAWGDALHGCALAALGRAQEGLPILHRGLAVTRAIGQGLHLPQTLTMLAYAYGKAGQFEEGLRRLAEAAEMAETTQDRWAEAELCRVRGDLLLATGRALEAENSFRQALSVARLQNGRLWELRIAVSLARLWHSEGRNEEARTLLQPIYAWFKTAVRTPDLEDAKELLGRLQLAPHR
jgi:class 3 adenylate cyclase/predicted ATPase